MSSSNKIPNCTDNQINIRPWIVLPDGLKEEFYCFSTYSELNDYRKNLESKFGDDRLKAFNIRANSKNVDKLDFEGGKRHSWALYYESDSVNKLFYYREVHPSKFRPTKDIDYSGIRDKQIGFRDWFADFAPKDWNDLLMVWNCFFNYAITGRCIDWKSLDDGGNELLNMHLRQSRGLLFWNHQFQSILGEAMLEVLDQHEYVNQNDCSRVMNGYLNKDHYPKSRRLVESLSVGGLSMIEILDKRWLVRNGPQNSLDRVSANIDTKSLELADFLWQYRRHD